MALRRVVSVPKIASQFGNSSLYETLRDMVAKISGRINEVDEKKVSSDGLTESYLPVASGDKALVDSTMYVDKLSGYIVAPTGLDVGTPEAGSGGPLNVAGVGATTIRRDMNGAAVSSPQAALDVGIRNAITSSGAGASILFNAPNSNDVWSYWGRISGYVNTPTAGAESGGIILSVRTNSADSTASTEALRCYPSAYSRLRVWDWGGQVFDVRAYGATGDGTTDDTTYIQAAITAAAAISPRGAVLFPPGTYKTTGSFNLTGLDGLQILGTGVGSSVIRLAHATNNLFYTTSTTSNLRIEGFTVISDTVTRTAGWVFEASSVYTGNGYLKKSFIRSMELRNQFNGIAAKQFEFFWMTDIFIWNGAGTTGRAVQLGQTTATNVNQGSEARLHNVQIYGNDLSSGTARYAAGFYIEDCDAVELVECGTGAIAGHGAVIMANAGGHAPSNHFIQCSVFDATDTGHAFWITGGGNVLNIKITDSWFASAGRMVNTSNGNGLRCDALNWASGEVVGNNFYNNRGTGLYIVCDSASVTVTGNTLNANGGGAAAGNNDGMYVALPLNALGPVICGNQEIGSNGVGIQTGVNTNRLVITGNRWVSGTTYGIAPLVNANNGA